MYNNIKRKQGLAKMKNYNYVCNSKVDRLI